MKLSKVGAAIVLAGICAAAAPTVWTHSMSSGRHATEATAPTQPVIVFGAALDPNTGEPKGFLAARLEIARRLYAAGKTDRIIVSGATDDHYSEPRSMRRYLERAGVPAAVIEQDDHGYDTYDTCIRARDVFGLTQVTLATQSYHLPRALAICSTLGLDAVGVGDETARQWQADWWFGVDREFAANFKMVWDLVTARPPKVGR